MYVPDLNRIGQRKKLHGAGRVRHLCPSVAVVCNYLKRVKASKASKVAHQHI